MKYFQNKTILLTGAFGGFGRQFIIQLLSCGAFLILTDLEVGPVSEILDIKETPGLPPDWRQRIIAEIPADLSSQDECRALYEQCSNLGRKIDMVIHNAAMSSLGAFIDTPQDYCEKSLLVNLFAVMRLNRFFLPGMIHEKSGHLIYISSVGGLCAASYSIPYTVSKFGIRALAMALHGEVKQFGIRTSIVYPFYSRTPILDGPVFGEPRVSVLPRLLTTKPESVVRNVLQKVAKGRLHICPDLLSKLIWYSVRLWPVVARASRIK